MTEQSLEITEAIPAEARKWAFWDELKRRGALPIRGLKTLADVRREFGLKVGGCGGCRRYVGTCLGCEGDHDSEPKQDA